MRVFRAALDDSSEELVGILPIDFIFHRAEQNPFVNFAPIDWLDRREKSPESQTQGAAAPSGLNVFVNVGEDRLAAARVAMLFIPGGLFAADGEIARTDHFEPALAVKAQCALVGCACATERALAACRREEFVHGPNRIMRYLLNKPG